MLYWIFWRNKLNFEFRQLALYDLYKTSKGFSKNLYITYLHITKPPIVASFNCFFIGTSFWPFFIHYSNYIIHVVMFREGIDYWSFRVWEPGTIIFVDAKILGCTCSQFFKTFPPLRFYFISLQPNNEAFSVNHWISLWNPSFCFLF